MFSTTRMQNDSISELPQLVLNLITKKQYMVCLGDTYSDYPISL